MTPRFYSQRNREYVYDVSVTKDETTKLAHRYRAHLSKVQRIEDRRLANVHVDVNDAYGPTVTEAMRALDAHFDAWRRAHPNTHG